MRHLAGSPSPRLSFWLVAAMLGMVSVPAYFTLHTAKVTSPPVALQPNPSPYGYTVSLLLFIIPIVAITCWFIPQEDLKISQKSLAWTIGLLFPLGALLDFLFASRFFLFPNAGATLGIHAPALHKPVPIEEYVFYLTGFLCIVLLYIWFDEYWLAAYTVPGTEQDRIDFDRLLRFHPQSLILAVVLIAAAFLYRRLFAPQLPGFPLPGSRSAPALDHAAALRPSRGQLESLQPHHVHGAAHQPALGGHPGTAVWLVEFPG
jgi:hypothetical protein